MARCIVAFAADPQDDTQVITQTKNSPGRSTLPSLVYRIISATVPTRTGDADVGRFVFDGQSDRSVQDILASYGSTAEAAEKTRAADFLRTALAGGPRRTTEVEEEAKQIHGIARRTLERARGKLRIPAAQRPTGEPRNKDGPAATEWWIALPGHEGDPPVPGQTANGRSPARHHHAPASTDHQTASPPTPQQAGGLHQQPDAGEHANVRKVSGSG